MKNDIVLVKYNNLKYDNLQQFTTTIDGGVSKGTYHSFNLSLFSGDKQEDVLENRRRLASVLEIDSKNLFVPYQTHEDKILVIDQFFLDSTEQQKQEQLHRVDSLVTREKDICIAVTTADCVPLLIYDSHKHVLAAVHAGWKGCANRIAAKTIARMKDLFNCNPSNILVAIGPSISPHVFEVGDEVGDIFIKNNFKLSDISFRNTITQKLHIDLWNSCWVQLTESGILPDNIECIGICTYSNPKLFYSARRQTINSGRMLTGGVLR